jgi:urease accessory protein
MDNAALHRLMAWLSPSYPVGSYSYSHGLEWLVEEGTVHDAASLNDWITDVLVRGSGRNDAIVFCQAYEAVKSIRRTLLFDVAELAVALAPSAERRLETVSQGEAFAKVTRDSWRSPTLEFLQTEGIDLAYPVAVAVTAADHGIALDAALNAFLYAFTSNLVSAGIRLIPLGHTEGQQVIAALAPKIELAAHRAMSLGIEDIGGSVILADIASMQHETQHTRLFRS